MNKYEMLDRITEVITDPTKLEKVEKFPEEILGLIVQVGFAEEDLTKLRGHNKLASNIRLLLRMKAVDYGSQTSKKWAEQERKFRMNINFIPYNRLFTKRQGEFIYYDVLAKSRIQRLNTSLGRPKILGEFGTEIVGAIPTDNQVAVLVKHNQIRWVVDHTRRYHEEMDELDCARYNIPKQLTIGELKRDDCFWLTAGPLDNHNTSYDFVIPAQ